MTKGRLRRISKLTLCRAEICAFDQKAFKNRTIARVKEFQSVTWSTGVEALDRPDFSVVWPTQRFAGLPGAGPGRTVPCFESGKAREALKVEFPFELVVEENTMRQPAINGLLILVTVVPAIAGCFSPPVAQTSYSLADAVAEPDPEADALRASRSAAGVLDLTDRANHVPATQLTLHETGLYAQPDTLQLAPGIHTYIPRYPLWSDGLKKMRYVQLPAGTKIDTDLIGTMDRWEFPVGTKFWKEFAIGGSGREASRRVETRFTEKLVGGKWAYATYLWNETGSAATRFDDRGHRNYVEIAPGVTHDIPSFNNCGFCHMKGTDPVLGFSALQLSGITSAERTEESLHAEAFAPGMLDIEALAAAELLTKKPERAPEIAARSSTERKVLGYFYGNCSSCHNSMGRANEYSVDFFVSVNTTAAEDHKIFKAIGKPSKDERFTMPGLEAGTPGFAITPGNPDASVLLYRMKLRGDRFQMPKVGSKVRDDAAIEAISSWMQSLETPAVRP